MGFRKGVREELRAVEALTAALAVRRGSLEAKLGLCQGLFGGLV